MSEILVQSRHLIDKPSNPYPSLVGRDSDSDSDSGAKEKPEIKCPHVSPQIGNSHVIARVSTGPMRA